MNKYLKQIEKQAGFLGLAGKTVSSFGRQAYKGAGVLPSQVGRLSGAIKQNGLFSSATGQAFKPILKNRAVQTGVGLAGIGYMAGRRSNP